jgi:hypothetical protein
MFADQVTDAAGQNQEVRPLPDLEPAFFFAGSSGFGAVRGGLVRCRLVCFLGKRAGRQQSQSSRCG